MTGRILIAGGALVTQDEALGTLRQGDILIEGSKIAAIAPRIEAGGAERVDAAGAIVIPGLINAHMHTWQTGLRAAAGDWSLPAYFRRMHAGLATLFRPEDIHIATLAGALNQIDCGTTTLVDWCHNNPSPGHTDAAVAGLTEAGIRAAFFHGSPKPDPKPGVPHFSEIPHPRSEVERLLAGPFAAGDQLLTLGMAILGPHYATIDVARHDLSLARELGLVASMHQGGGTAKTPGGWDVLIAEGLVGDHVNIVHGNDLPDHALRRFVDLGVSFAVTPGSEMLQGHGHPITGRLRALGAAPALGVDLESAMPGDMFEQLRIAWMHQRALDNVAHRQRHGAPPEDGTLDIAEALTWVTVSGARMLKMQDRIGRLAPGLQADLVLLRSAGLGLSPIHDPLATAATQAGPQHVEAVMIGGLWRKRDHRVLGADLAAVKSALARSGHRILTDLERRTDG